MPYKYKINDEEGEFIKKYFPIFGVGYCRKKLNKTTSQIESFVLKNKIKSNKDYKCDINDYINLWTPEIVYTLGFLWADGSVSKASKKSYLISVTVTKSDSSYLKKVLDKWGDFKWKTYEKKALQRVYKGQVISGKPCVMFYLSDKYISNFLVENDYEIESKSSPFKILNLIPDHLKHYWWRGYFDGDGCFVFKMNENGKSPSVKIQLSSNIDQDWKFFEILCEELGIRCSIYKTRSKLGKGSTVNIGNVNGCIKFFEFIYKNYENDKIGYERKFIKSQQANLKTIKKTSNYIGVCLDISKRVNRWVCYFRGKYIGCANSQSDAKEIRDNYIKEIKK